MSWPFGDLVPLRYGVILADPPWGERRLGNGEAEQERRQWRVSPPNGGRFSRERAPRGRPGRAATGAPERPSRR